MAQNRKRQQENIKEFVKYYLDIAQTAQRIQEKKYDQSFWRDLIQYIFGEANPDRFLQFQKEIKDQNNTTKWIDIYIPKTRVIIEQKTSNIDLNNQQPNHDYKTPYEQALEYQNYLPTTEKAKWIVVSNFKEIHIYNMDTVQPLDTKVVIKLEELPKRYLELKFLIDNTAERIIHEKEISIQAGKTIGQIYDLLIKEYTNHGFEISEDDFKHLNILAVRLVFLMYAEDAGMLDEDQQFGNFIRKYHNDPSVFRSKLIELFTILNTSMETRDKWLDPILNKFEYINGGLFKENITIPTLSHETVDLLLEASEGTDWSDISPTIFGAIFESTLNPITRRSGGMHYTSIENIHKVIDPLFLTELKNELAEIKNYKQKSVRQAKARDFQDKIASLKFLDPACGSGNFLTETYIELRKLENEVLSILSNKQAELFESEKLQIKVSLSQFYGIEINDFAVAVAKTALWIAEYQMLQETLNLGIVLSVETTLPLKNYDQILEANALRFDWKDLLAPKNCDYIIGNPPFVGARLMSKEQKSEILNIWKDTKNSGNLDYVTGWYKIAANYMLDTSIQASLVSTNSLCQGEQTVILWKYLFENGIKINNAYQTFIWNSESTDKAHVYCIIIQFSYIEQKNKCLIDKLNTKQYYPYINQYLLPFKAPFISSRTRPISVAPEIGIGNKPIDGGYYLFEEDEMKNFIKQEPNSEKYFKRWYGADEFLNNKTRYCLWLGDCSPNEIKTMPLCKDRVAKVKEYRLESKNEGTRKLALNPTRFHVENMPKEDNYFLIPCTSSENRIYIPIGFMTTDDICSNACLLVQKANTYHFGIMTSIIHMAWMRTVAGRLKSDYRYSKDIVYNNFVWINATEEQKEKITKTAQTILDARNLYPNDSLATLYDDILMPTELRKAHKANDKAVLALYGLSPNATESEMVARMFELYQAKVSGVNNTGLDLL